MERQSCVHWNGAFDFSAAFVAGEVCTHLHNAAVDCCGIMHNQIDTALFRYSRNRSEDSLNTQSFNGDDEALCIMASAQHLCCYQRASVSRCP